MNKKGFIGDAITIIISMAVLAIGVGVVIFFVSNFNTAIQNNSVIDSDTKSMVSDFSNKYPTSWDYFVVILMIGLPIISAVFSFFLDATAITFWIMVLITPLIVVIGAFAATLWDGFLNSLTATAASMPLTSYLFEHYALYTLYVIVVVVAGLFFKTRQTA